MALTGQDLLKARNVRVAAGYPDSVGLTLFVVDGPTWFAAYAELVFAPGRRALGAVSPHGQGNTDISALNALFAAMVAETAATATAEAAQSTGAASIAAAVAAAAA
jgi:hypothetical protein